MKVTVTPIIYDFKRSFLRVSTLVFIIIFLLGGLGVTYLAYQSFTMQYPSVNAVVVVVFGNGTCRMTGLVYDAFGRPINNAEISLKDAGGNTIASYRVSGNFTISPNELCREKGVGIVKELRSIHVRTQIGEVDIDIVTYNITGPVAQQASNTTGYIVFGRISSTGYFPRPVRESAGGPTPSWEEPFLVYNNLIVIDKKTGDAVLVVVAVKNNATMLYKPSLELYYSMATTSSGRGSFGAIYGFTHINLSSLNYTYLGRLNDYIKEFKIKIDPDKDLLVLKAYDPELNASSYDVKNYGLLPPAKAAYTGALAAGAPMNLMTEFLPILFLYLSYVLLAKPKSIGALEFILARPVTRWDIYLTRWVGGVITAIISTAILVLGIDAGAYILLGFPLPMNDLALLYLGVTGALIAFYTLTYMIAAGLRSGLYLAISIALYLLFAMFWGLIVLIAALATGAGLPDLTTMSYGLAYFNPLGVSSIASYYIQRDYGLIQEIDVVNPWLAAGSFIGWVTICFIVGYIIFKRTNLLS